MCEGHQPIPVVDESLLMEIKNEINQIKKPPDCPALRKCFINIIMETATPPIFASPDIDSIIALFSKLLGKLMNADKLLQYYVETYPAYPRLRERVSVFAGIDEIGLDEVLDQWYLEFFCYLKLKLEAVPVIMKPKPMHSVATMTSPPATPSKTRSKKLHCSEFCLEICGPSHIINNLVFSTDKNDVQIRYHKNKQWELNESSLSALINFPYVGFDVNIADDISFKRTNDCDYERFVVGKQTPNIRTPQNRLRRVEFYDLLKPSVVFSHGFICTYIKELVQLIKQCSDVVPEWRKLELQVVMKEFLADVAEINLYNRGVFATNTSVSYVIGDSKYVRYRCVRTTDVNFIEILTPIVTVALKNFEPRHSTYKGEVWFKTLQYYSKNIKEFEKILNGNNVLNYNCSQCVLNFTSYTHMLEHYRQMHGQQAGVVCEHCKMSVEVADLAALRWRHNCFDEQ